MSKGSRFSANRAEEFDLIVMESSTPEEEWREEKISYLDPQHWEREQVCTENKPLPVQVVEEHLEALNLCDVDRLMRLRTHDFTYVFLSSNRL